ncbi:uncharacterized protein PHALS_00930 [Plasmopara halstedii]|uniref:Uncharacterized protein n=1 Tax=Plasmopara halstedii TaxID=4781 RepID=A0A0N7L6L1_PLAHL|nr:uncharacterized protein PHALS_00930 [Plasmopara halstedii]CEG44579.1 hypothetical protein PHALS_00930 [Plasmopara halstedii]|eukprot:XP_024580948.1 hypothetical protein PHALS_00930 [Plasmopara halstedii]
MANSLDERCLLRIVGIDMNPLRSDDLQLANLELALSTTTPEGVLFRRPMFSHLSDDH